MTHQSQVTSDDFFDFVLLLEQLEEKVDAFGRIGQL
jgi:hypothetical protein